MASTHGLIRTIYLYLFALVGLFVFVFGLVSGVGATLNRYVWPQEFVQYNYATSATAPVPVAGKTTTAPTLEQQKADFHKQQDNDFRRSVTESLPAILIGWLLWWFHWGWIKRDQHNLVN